MTHSSSHGTYRAAFSKALLPSVLLTAILAGTNALAQQGLPLPPVFRDMAALGVTPVPGQQQPGSQGADPGNPVANGNPDPYHIFDKQAAAKAALPQPAPAQAAKPAAGRPHGSPTVVVLRNGRVVQGSIRADSRGYFVESARSSLYFPFEHVRFVAADVHEAYIKLCDSISGTSARRDLLLGRWCLENGLNAEAADHFGNVLRFEPANREARQGLARIEQLQPEEPVAEVSAKPASPSRDAAAPESLSQLSGSAVREFVIGVQPILLARCGSVKCHGGSDPSAPGVTSFHLEHVRLSQGSNRAATARNLDAVLNLLDGQFPTQSRLFQKGLAPHGGSSMRPPLDGAAGRTQEMRIRRWVELIAPERNRLRREQATRAFINRFARSQKPPTLRDPRVVPAGGVEGADDGSAQPAQEAPGSRLTGGFQNPASEPRQMGSGPTGLRQNGPLTDPFDPAPFNAGH